MCMYLHVGVNWHPKQDSGVPVKARHPVQFIFNSKSNSTTSKMKQGLLPWCPCQYQPASTLHSPLIPFIALPFSRTKRIVSPITAAFNSTDTEQLQQLTAKERRQLRKERRESKSGYNWREEVEERLIKKPKRKATPRSADLNLDSLADLGYQWWVIKVSRVRGHETADLIARQLARNYPEMEFKVYFPAVQEKKKLKNGTYSVKPKPIFPGCVFLWCVLNKEIHDFIREKCPGVGGFVGAKVGNMNRQINRPRPVSADDMEELFQQAKEEQENYDKAFEEVQQVEGVPSTAKLSANGVTDSNPKRRSRKISDPLGNGSSTTSNGKLTSGSTVRVVSGTFAEFVGSIKKVNRKTGKATVGFTLFGKESLVDLDLHEIVAETQ